MTREELVRLVYMSGHCPKYSCLPTTLKQCMECHNKELTEYENEIYNKALEDLGVYEKGRADVLNAIKNDLHERLTEEINKPHQDQGLCEGLYYAIQRCDWFLSDDKEQSN